MPSFVVLTLLVSLLPSRDLASPAIPAPIQAHAPAPVLAEHAEVLLEHVARHDGSGPSTAVDADQDFVTDGSPESAITTTTQAPDQVATTKTTTATTTIAAVTTTKDYVEDTPGTEIAAATTKKVKDYVADTPGTESWSTTGEGNPLTVPKSGTLLAGLDIFFATLWVCMIASVPLVFAIFESKTIAWTHVAMGFGLFAWLFTGMYLFSHTIHFSSGHWVGARCLSTAETIYFMTQILTTVGYGDIVPSNSGGRTVIAFYVLVTVCLIADMVSDVRPTVVRRFRESVQADSTGELRNDGAIQWVPRAEMLPFQRFWQALLIYVVFAGVGVLFYCTFQDEGKDLPESIYMSIITLSTVGFGAFTADTEGGMVFGAFWMVFGVAALVNLVAAFGGLMLAWKQRTKLRKPDYYREFIDTCHHIRHDGQGMIDEYEFVRLAVLHSKLVTLEELNDIEDSFQKLGPNVDDKVYLSKVKSDLMDVRPHHLERQPLGSSFGGSVDAPRGPPQYVQ